MSNNLKEIAKKLNIGVSSLYKWKETRKELYEFIIENYDKNYSPLENNELLEYYEQLEEEEKAMYLSEIKARVLRKKLK